MASRQQRASSSVNGPPASSMSRGTAGAAAGPIAPARRRRERPAQGRARRPAASAGRHRRCGVGPQVAQPVHGEHVHRAVAMMLHDVRAAPHQQPPLPPGQVELDGRRHVGHAEPHEVLSRPRSQPRRQLGWDDVRVVGRARQGDDQHKRRACFQPPARMRGPWDAAHPRPKRITAQAMAHLRRRDRCSARSDRAERPHSGHVRLRCPPSHASSAGSPGGPGRDRRRDPRQ